MIPLARLLADSSPARPALETAAGRVSWQTLAERAGGVAQRLGSVPSGPVALLCPDGDGLAAALLGTLAAGREALLAPHPAVLAGVARAVTIDADWLAATGTAEPRRAPLAGTVGFFTSGSTGTPQLVRRGLAGLQAELDSFHAQWGAAASGRVAATVPRAHLYGLTFSLLWPLAAGGVAVAPMWHSWESVWDGLDGATVLVSSPAHLTRMAGLAPLPPARRPRLVLSAGSALPAPAAREAAGLLGCAVDEVFGSTETGAVATRRLCTGEEPWRPLPGVAVRAGAEGRLELCSPALEAPGWHPAADRIARAEEGGAEEGFRLLGRADRVAKVEGKRVDLGALEVALRASGWVAEAAVLMLPGPPEVLVAVVVPNPAGRHEQSARGSFRFGRALRARLAAGQEAVGLPRRWRFVAALPEARMGKPDAAALRALFLP